MAYSVYFGYCSWIVQVLTHQDTDSTQETNGAGFFIFHLQVHNFQGGLNH